MSETAPRGEADGSRRGPMPQEIANAVLQVMACAKQLGFDEKNVHGGYAYASIDKFLAAFRPLCAEAGLIIVLDEVACEFRAGPETREGRQMNYAFLTYEIWLTHACGTTWGPLIRRLALPATGPQTFGAAESYVLKRFMRTLFQVPTGEKDADELPAGTIPAAAAAPPATDLNGDAEVRTAYARLRTAIDDCQSVQEVNGILHGTLWQDWENAMKATHPQKHATVRDVLLNRAEKRKDALMIDQEQLQ